jgi:hypothetical protein
MPGLLLTPDELVELTTKRRADAQAAALQHMGIPFAPRPDGSLAVLRSVVERRLGGAGTMPAPAEPELQP